MADDRRLWDVSESHGATGLSTSSFFGLRSLHTDIEAASCGLNLLSVEDIDTACTATTAAAFGQFEGLISRSTSDGQNSSCYQSFEGNLDSLFPAQPNRSAADQTRGVREHRQDVSKTVFVGNLNFKANPATIRIFFKKFGRVKDVFLTNKHGNRTHKRVAFVKFAKMESAKKAIEASEEDATMDNRHLRIFPASEKKMKMHSQDASEADGATCSTDLEGDQCSVELNDDTMLLILNYLNPEELLKVENVCRRWRALALTAWSSKQRLSFKGCFSPFAGKLFSDGLLKLILRRCSSNVKFLDISTVSRLLRPHSIGIIAKYCENLEELDISGLRSTNESMAHLAKSCVKLKKITLGMDGTTGEKGIWALLNKCQSLEYVDISHNNRATGQCFHRFGPNVHVLKLNSCGQVGSPGFEKIAQRCPDLVDLRMNSCTKLIDEKLNLICTSCTKITKLDLGGLFADLTTEGLSHIKHLKHLEELYLSQNKAAEDTLLLTIGDSCQLLRGVFLFSLMNSPVLDLSACSNEISDVGLNALANCSKLSILNVSYLQNWTDDALLNLSVSCPLTELTARACISVSDVGYQSAINLCPRLQLLDVSGCKLLTEALVKTAIDVVSNREHGPKLLLYIGGTRIDVKTLQCEHPLLEISSHSNCVSRLMPVHDDPYWDSDDDDDDDDDADYFDDENDDVLGFEDGDDWQYDDDDFLFQEERRW